MSIILPKVMHIVILRESTTEESVKKNIDNIQRKIESSHSELYKAKRRKDNKSTEPVCAGVQQPEVSGAHVKTSN